MNTNRIFKVGLMTLLSLLFIGYSLAQDGLRFYDDKAMEGYMLYQSGNSAVLVDNCGHLVHEWNEVAAMYHPKLLSNGNLVYIERASTLIIEKDWDDNLVNELSIASLNITLDYEVIVLENGNYLCVARKEFSLENFIDLGYAVGSPSDGISKGFPIHYDTVVEIDRISGNIAWEWNIMDHVIQERDSSKGNYGSIADHPELLNMDAISISDWSSEAFMINGIDYNKDLDQIALSLRKISEVVIIDHSTTTQEAAGHTGGNSGKGGDILYRWGNPQNYQRGNISDRYLFYQHNPNWIEYGPHKGKLIIYNNGRNRPNTSSFDNYSSVPIIDTNVDENGDYPLLSSMPFGPTLPDEDYSKVTTGNNFYSEYTSASKVLSNENILVTIGGDDRTFELLPDGTLVWEYGLVDPGLTFRVEKYALDYPAFEGRELVAGDVLEFPPSDVPCSLVDVDENYFEDTKVWLANAKVFIETNIDKKLQLSISSIEGKLMKRQEVVNGDRVDVSDLVNGVYLVTLVEQQRNITYTYKVYR